MFPQVDGGQRDPRDRGVYGPAFFNVRPHSMGETRFLLCVGKPLKKRFGVATYFCFILKGKNKIRKKNPKYDS